MTNVNLKEVNTNKGLKEKFLNLQQIVAEAKDIKKDWNDQEFTAVKKAIYKFFRNLTITDRNGRKHTIANYERIDNLLGLAYTSSSSFAGLWTCNENLYINESCYINGFYITNDNKLCVNTQDTAEQSKDYIIIQFEKTIKEQLISLGMKPEEIGSWCSDLHILKNEISEKFINGYEFKNLVKVFRSEIDHKLWYEIPFAYTEYYNSR